MGFGPGFGPGFGTGFARNEPGAPVIVTSKLAPGYIGVPYERTLFATGGGPYTWTVISGALPDGLTLDLNTGVISGTPTTEESATFTVQAENAQGTDDREFTINIFAEMEEGGVISSGSMDAGMMESGAIEVGTM